MKENLSDRKAVILYFEFYEKVYDDFDKFNHMEEPTSRVLPMIDFLEAVSDLNFLPYSEKQYEKHNITRVITS